MANETAKDWSLVAVESVSDIAPCSSKALLEWMGILSCGGDGELQSGWQSLANEGVLKARSDGSITQDQQRQWQLTETGERRLRDLLSK